MASYHRFFLIFVGLGLAVYAAQAQSELPDPVKAMEGRWNGTYEIRNPEGMILRLIQVEYQYWVEDEVLNGLAVFEQAGELSHAKSRSFMEEGQLISEIVSGGITRRFLGRLVDQAVIWEPEELERRPNRKIKETVVEREEKAFLVVDGFERILRGEESTMVVYKGLLERDLRNNGPKKRTSDSSP